MRNLSKVIAMLLGVLPLGSAVLACSARAEGSSPLALTPGLVAEEDRIHSPLELSPGSAPFLARQREAELDDDDTPEVQCHPPAMSFSSHFVQVHHLVKLHRTSVEPAPMLCSTISAKLRC